MDRPPDGNASLTAVRALPPNEFLSSRVSIESRYLLGHGRLVETPWIPTPLAVADQWDRARRLEKI
jgi:hypothetical protein